MIVIVDYGIGNLTSIANAFRKLGVEANVSSDTKTIAAADGALLPGVGNFATCMNQFDASGLRETLETFALVDKKPLMGICVGMQMLSTHSEEGDAPGLGWIVGQTVSFPTTLNDARLKVPHVGWNEVTGTSSSLFENLDLPQKFYFAHSFYVICPDDRDVIGRTIYGTEFAAAVQRDNIYGTQFHPEKSHKVGGAVLQNFAAQC